MLRWKRNTEFLIEQTNSFSKNCSKQIVPGEGGGSNAILPAGTRTRFEFWPADHFRAPIAEPKAEQKAEHTHTHTHKFLIPPAPSPTPFSFVISVATVSHRWESDSCEKNKSGKKGEPSSDQRPIGRGQLASKQQVTCVCVRGDSDDRTNDQQPQDSQPLHSAFSRRPPTTKEKTFQEPNLIQRKIPLRRPSNWQPQNHRGKLEFSWKLDDPEEWI